MERNPSTITAATAIAFSWLAAQMHLSRSWWRCQWRLAGSSVGSCDQGRRAAMILGDEHMPSGELRWTISARRGDGSVRPETPVAHVRLSTLDGLVVCEEDIPYGILFPDRFSDVWIPCRLPSEGPATLFVETLGVVDLAFDEVTLTWRSD